MKLVHQVKWTKRAQLRFREQHDYITQENCREVALAWGRHILDATEPLGKFPFSGRVVPEIGRLDIREVIVEQHYRVIYKVRKTICDILTIRHTAFLIKSMRSL